MFSSLLLTLLVFNLNTEKCSARMQPAEFILPTDIDKALIPNERTTLNDCHLRYHKYGEFNLVYPVHGVPARSKEFAHMAVLGWTKTDGTISWDCGGSLITDNYVLTAAHCAINDDNIGPDTVRLGDIDLTSIEGDDLAQQLKIAEIKRHPDHSFFQRYNDIALVRLNGRVTITDAVIPTCLWKEENVDFEQLEAIGFGLTSAFGEKTPNLLKVSLAPVTKQECLLSYPVGTRRLTKGVIGSQVCAKDEKMDTCQGDSGGPLQIKLLSNLRLTPYVIGITSFGASCGQSVPAIYTRVSSFVDWIEKEVGQSFEPTQCALRYVQFREFEPAMVNSKVWDSVFIEPERSYMDLETVARHRVYLGWTKADRTVQWNCGGVLINEDYVVSAAHCDKFIMGKTPDMVKVGDLDIFKDAPDAQKIRIERFIPHPQYGPNSIENDIALVKLAQDVKFSLKAVPACLVNNDDLKVPDYEMAGLGAYNLNQFFRDPNTDLRNGVLSLTRMRVGSLPASNCSSTFRLNNIQSQKIACAGNKQSLVPKVCRIEHGGPMEREIWHFDRYYAHVFGITVSGDNCGFGSPILTVKISAHIDWIESIVLNKRRFKRQAAYSIDSSLNVGDSCTTPAGESGICVRHPGCESIAQDFKNGKKEVKFCAFNNGAVLCCPKQPIANRQEISSTGAGSGGSGGNVLNQCITHYRETKRNNEDFFGKVPSEGRFALPGEYGYIVAVGWTNDLSCTGSIISDSFILTSASCVSKNPRNGLPTTVRIGDIKVSGSNNIGNGQEVSVFNVMTHPNFNSVNKLNDLALVQVRQKIRFNENVGPVCLWTNKANTPLKLQSIGWILDAGTTIRQLMVRPRSAIYNEDCSKILSNFRESLNLCAENYFLSGNVCQESSGDSLGTNIALNGMKIPFAVGIHSSSKSCGTQPAIFTRISSYIDWIKSIVST